MWCNCIENTRISIGCYNHNISSSIISPLVERIKVNGVYIDFNNIEDVLMVVREIDDPHALDFSRLSLSNGEMDIVPTDPTYLYINFPSNIYSYSGNHLYYELYVKEDGNLYPIQKGKILIQKIFS